MENVLHWAEEHPWLAGGLTLGAVFLLLWLFGFFGSSSASSNNGTTNLAAAYYAAEAAQTTASTQLQEATVAYGAQTAQTQIQATAAENIATTQAGLYTTLGQQQQDTTLGGDQFAYLTSTTLGAQQLASSNHSADDALAATVVTSNNATTTAVSGNQASELASLTSLIPSEFATAGQPNSGLFIGGLGTGNFSIAQTQSSGGGPADTATLAQLSPQELAALGYAPVTGSGYATSGSGTGTSTAV